MPSDPVPVAIETPRGLLVASLRATGRPVYAINPLAVARYRERHSVARSKSDHADAMTLANILRVDAHLHRRLPADSELCQAIAVLARAHQDAIWRRTTAHHQLRSLLREFYPTFLAVFTGRFTLGIASPEARAVLAIAPTPAAAAKLSVSRVAAALRRAGRRRGIDQTAAEIKAGLRKPQLRQPLLVETPWVNTRWLCSPTRYRLRQCGRARPGVGGIVPTAPRLRDHHQFSRAGGLDRCPGACRDR